MNTLNLREKNNKFATIYYGKVVDIMDPTKQGRIKVDLKEVWGDSDPKQTPWIYPIGYNSGLKLFNVPDQDSEVGVFFIGDFYTGFYGIGKYPKGEAKIFDDDYPNLYGFEDAQGNYLIINKNTGLVKFHHRSGSEILMDVDGNTSANIKGTFTGSIEKDVKLTAPKTELITDLTVSGKCTITDTCTFEGIKWKTHVHPYYWTDGGGSANSSPPKN